MARIASLSALSSDCSACNVGLSNLVKVLPGVCPQLVELFDAAKLHDATVQTLHDRADDLAELHEGFQMPVSRLWCRPQPAVQSGFAGTSRNVLSTLASATHTQRQAALRRWVC